MDVIEPFVQELSGYQTVIVANGAFPQSRLALHLLQNAEQIIGCDGAIRKFEKAHITPQVLVGDCDSMDAESMIHWKDILHIDRSEEYNDLQKALKFCLAQHPDPSRPIILLGCDGLRDDHYIANISIMACYSTQLPLVMVTQSGIFNIIHRTATLTSVPGQQISVFSKDERLRLTFHGLKYPVTQRAFHYLWEGSLNEDLGEQFTIELEREGLVLVYREVRD